MLRPRSIKTRVIKSLSVALMLLMVITVLPTAPHAPASAQTAADDPPSPLIPVIAPGSAYRQTNLVSDLPGLAPVQDPLLVNPWGISLTASSPFWVANAGTSTATLYRETSSAPLVKNPGLAGITIPGQLPTGTVANGTSDFVVPGACASPPCAANFIFASITGNITAWDPNAPAAGSTTAVIAADPPNNPGPRVYTGLANGSNSGGNRLYAADFNNGNIDVYNGTFALTTVTGNFADPTIPTTAGNTFHPHNIQNIGGLLYVTYAKVGADGKDVEGVGNGFVRRFNTDGVRDLTFGINNGALNSPWGITIAPASFGIFGGALLIGNFGRGNPSIHAFNPTTGAFLGTIQDESGNGIEIDELWALTFGNGGNGGDVNTLYFTAGTANEQHGLFGSLKPTTASATSLIQFSTDDFTISEGTGHIDVTITRSGDASGTATVNFNTFDESAPGHASQKSDYEIALGKVSFAAGETSKTVRILIVNDIFVEGDETIDIALSNPTGAGAGLGSPNVTEVTITDNDSLPPTTNPIDDASFFVRQNYLDFLNREPDDAGFAFWVNQITSCGGNQQCIADKRVNVSAAFFLSIEFQNTGFLVYRTHRAAFGPNVSGSPAPVLYGQFERDTQALQKNFIFGQPGAEAQLEANKVAYFNDFVTKPEFVNKYPAALTNEQYVDNLLASANLSPSQVRLFVVSMTNAQEVPPANPTASGGGARPASFGTARLRFNSAQTAMTFTSTVNNIDFTGSQTPGDTNDNLTVAHIHAGAAVTPATNGPVVWGFFGNPFNDNNPNDQQVIPFTSGVGGRINGKWDAPEGNNTTLAAQLSNLREGRAYVNFHTTQFGGDEVRGNVPAATAFRDALVAGLNGATETRATVLRKVAESEEIALNEFNSAFVFMEYAGYLRRDPDTAGFNFWLNKLNAFNGNFIEADMVKAFVTSTEYRQRFGPS
ncbi:MAG: TIGR03118 family protein [Rubrivivax sp.]|nr:TIGR03118 family protein [Pyrinomonadaceae bacterium]